LVVELNCSPDEVNPLLGSHIWKDILPNEPRRHSPMKQSSSTDKQSKIFLLNKSQWKFISKGWRSVAPPSPHSFRPSSFKIPYPQPGPADVPPNDRLSIPLDIARRPPRDPAPAQTAVDIGPASRSRSPSSQPADPSSTGSGSGWTATLLPEDTTPPEDVKPRVSPADGANEMPASFIVIYNRMGVDWNRPTDFSGVVKWLESGQLFGANSITAFWARPLDLRLIAQMRVSDAKLHSMVGIHDWDQCLTRYTGRYPLEHRDRRTHVHILRKNLWTHLHEEGFRKFAVDRQRRIEGTDCLARDPYPAPEKGEPPEYYDSPEIQMLGEPSRDVL